MTTATENLFALWMWPLGAARLAGDFAETMTAAQRVVAARLPVMATAFRNPLGADHRELGRMVKEKVDAFGASGRSISAAGESVQRASTGNARAFGRMASGGWIGFDQWNRVAEANLAALAALVALPAAALAPLHAGVVANDRRLGGRLASDLAHNAEIIAPCRIGAVRPFKDRQ